MTEHLLYKKISNLVKEEVEQIKYGRVLSEGMRFHIENKVSFYDNIYRPTSKNFFLLVTEMKEMHKEGLLELSLEEKELAESDIGTFGMYGGRRVPLDMPFITTEKIVEAEYKGKKVELGKPKRGGSKKFYVYTKCGDKVKKVSFGSPDMSLKISDPERRKSFVARHKCKEKNDRGSAGYWACRIGRYPSLTGASKSFTWW